ncbi:protein-tyrosine phosphatase-like protein [Hyaloraphidium curvatum]|nr:protein-tyrosine phosphatase-like protein [Hyaloraphidium curvatum]
MARLPAPPFLEKFRKLSAEEQRRSVTKTFREINLEENERRMKDETLRSGESLVKVIFGLRTFIASQGPLAGTAGDFWEMVWDQKTRVVVMLEENGREKVFKYWPSSGVITFKTPIGDLAVRLIREEDKGGAINVRRFGLQLGAEGEEREVVQVQYSGWPDHGIPEETGSMLRVLDVSNDYQRGFIAKEGKDRVGPMVVHCSAGCGRTGTLIALDTFLRLLELDTAKSRGLKTVDILTEQTGQHIEPVDWSQDWIKEIVRHLRTQRNTMVQALDQLRFLYIEPWARLGE